MGEVARRHTSTGLFVSRSFIVDDTGNLLGLSDRVPEYESGPAIDPRPILYQNPFRTPAAVIRTTDVRVGPLSSVDEQFAWDEGEGQRTRDWWLAEHRRYFRRAFATSGWQYDDDLAVVFERFVVVWPPECADDL